MHVLVAPDSFKGSLSALEVANIMAKAIYEIFPRAQVTQVPMADGGEGTVEAILTGAGGRWEEVEVKGPLGADTKARYGILPDGETAVIEMAAASGLTLVPVAARNPLLTTTFGTGQLILDALNKGCRKVVVGIGGSATNDGGMGMAQALGVRFLDADGQELGLGGAQLKHIAAIDTSAMDPRIAQTGFIVACDVDNPLVGPRGAAAVYGPQKGATPEMVKELDQGLSNFAATIKATLGLDISYLPGAGAAGGLGGGLMAFCHAQLEPGIQVIDQTVGLEEKIAQADLVLTGEGNTDEQTLYGKVPVGIGRLAKKHGVPVYVISGGMRASLELYQEGITAAFGATQYPVSVEEAMGKAREFLYNTTLNVMRAISVFY